MDILQLDILQNKLDPPAGAHLCFHMAWTYLLLLQAELHGTLGQRPAQPTSDFPFGCKLWGNGFGCGLARLLAGLGDGEVRPGRLPDLYMAWRDSETLPNLYGTEGHDVVVGLPGLTLKSE